MHGAYRVQVDIMMGMGVRPRSTGGTVGTQATARFFTEEGTPRQSGATLTGIIYFVLCLVDLDGCKMVIWIFTTDKKGHLQYAGNEKHQTHRPKTAINYSPPTQSSGSAGVGSLGKEPERLSQASSRIWARKVWSCRWVCQVCFSVS